MLDTTQDQKIKEFVLSNIVTYCDKCGTKYKISNLDIIYNTTDTVVVQAKCSKCGAKYIVQLTPPFNATQKLPIILDLKAEQIPEYLSLGPINNDLILFLHSKLTQNKHFTIKDLLKISYSKPKLTD